MVEKMRQDNMLEPLDHRKLTGLKNYDPTFMNEPFDPKINILCHIFGEL
ncbi:Spermidine/putrescine-binding periplasmic protein precursor [Weissella viridescens]|uniref:Spermidine/putrescine-binding periplasmic protein n=1 Tax=Weissella viridescens TaxID=1629 RepID=A0A380NY66_WEIVI|nr:Spermidine/putrescine-binding periplasmic protein precursor [Weissella viridescens]